MNFYVQCPTVYPLELLNKTADNRIFVLSAPTYLFLQIAQILYIFKVYL